MPTMIEHFDHLTDFGLKVIPLKVNSKAPISNCWQKNWNHKKNRNLLNRFPDANIGLLLGEVIDVEGDSDYANKTLINLIGDCPHPCYRSTRSVHHLFKTPDPQLRILKYREIEFRSTGHQSVLPPSQHFGVEYRWLTKLMPIPEMPDKLRRFYDKINGEKSKVKPGCMQVWCSACRNECYLHKKRFQLELEAFKLMSSLWECQNCRTIDMRPMVRALRNN
jgi:hypothetical protein